MQDRFGLVLTHEASQQQTNFGDPGSSSGVTPHKVIRGSEGNEETLDPSMDNVSPPFALR